MLPRFTTPLRPALAILLLAACTPPSPADEAGECVIPTNEDAPAAAQRIVFTNEGDQPLFIVPPRDCSDSLMHALDVDGIEVADDVLETCATLIDHGCDSCDESDYGRWPVRIDPGGLFEWSFDAYVYEPRSFAGCGLSAACWSGDECPAGVAVAIGATLTAELRTTGECTAGAACECPAAAAACELTDIVAGDMAFGELAPRSFEFPYDGELTTVVPL